MGCLLYCLPSAVGALDVSTHKEGNLHFSSSKKTHEDSSWLYAIGVVYSDVKSKGAEIPKL